MDTIYLDYNATAPMRPEVLDFIAPLLAEPCNASSIHSYGRKGRQLVEAAREQVGRLVGTDAAQVIFNSGATEANNTVLRHFAGERILVSAIEHVSVLESGVDVETIPVTPGGAVDLVALEASLKDKPTALVCVMLVNNEIGVVQPVAEISALAKAHGALVHCDAVQAAGRIPIDMQALGVDFLSLSAHKIGGPQGVGALCLGICGVTPVLLEGGGQEKKARAGTENVAGIAGFGLAAELVLEGLETYEDTLLPLRRRLEEWVLKHDGARIYGAGEERVANTVMFSLPGIKAETALMAMDLAEIAISNGSACSSGTVQPSHVLRAMGASAEEALRGLRISMGAGTSESDIERFIEAFEKFIRKRINNA